MALPVALSVALSAVLPVALLVTPPAAISGPTSGLSVAHQRPSFPSSAVPLPADPDPALPAVTQRGQGRSSSDFSLKGSQDSELQPLALASPHSSLAPKAPQPLRDPTPAHTIHPVPHHPQGRAPPAPLS